MIWFDLVSVWWHINLCSIFNAKSCLYIYIKYILFFFFVFVLWHINSFRLYNAKSSLYIYHHHHHHVMPPARISLTLSRHFYLSFIASERSSGLHPVSSHSCCMYVRAGRPDFARPYVDVCCFLCKMPRFRAF